MKRGEIFERATAFVVWSAAATTIAALIFIVGFILFKGIPHINPAIFSLEYTSENASMTPAIISTAMMTTLALLIAVPFGVSAAIYLAEYAKRESWAAKIARMTAETLSGIPSIIHGLFGLLFFVVFLGWGFSLLSGAFTLAIMILPLIMRASEEALQSVPDSYREGAFGLGAGKLRMILKIALPSAMGGIFAGVTLAIGRIVGETAALIYTAGTVAQIPSSPMESARTLSVHMYALSSEGLHIDEGYATAAALLAIVIVINALSAYIAKKAGGDA
ncbi:MAG: phosphate ABC transporter permease PstA [Helicobacteraceae bacterium]|jgi:phosphate transport system permease protein|nr:phosphate ABC transporter permease PstA [Helicobacteraceae bacterium]